MPDKQIIDLPALDELKDTDYLVVGRPSAPEPAQKMQGTQLAAFVDKSAQPHVTEAAKQAQAAAASAQTATTKASEASKSTTQAQNAQQGAATAQAAAEAAQGKAESAQTAAESAKAGADTAKAAAEAAQGKAEQALTGAISAKTEAESAQGKAETAKTEAESAKKAAETALQGANSSAQTASRAKEAAESAKMEAQKAQRAIEDMGVSVESLQPDTPPEVVKSIVQGVVNLLFKIPQGRTGPKGDIGPQGVSIDRIEKTNGDGSPGTNDTYTIYLDDGTSYPFQVLNGPQGPQGNGFTIKFTYDTLGELEAAVPVPELGMNAYIGTTQPYDVYSYTQTDSGNRWVNGGKLQGPEGSPGADGISPTVEVTPVENGHQVTITDKTGSKTFTVKNGENGANGAPGPAGATGKSAYASAQDGGYTGSESQFNADLAGVSSKQRVVDLGTLSFSAHGSYENSAQLTEEQMDEIFSSSVPPILLFTVDGQPGVNSVAFDVYDQTSRIAISNVVSGDEGFLSSALMQIGYYSGSFEGPLVVISNYSYFNGISDEEALIAAKQIELPSDPTQPMEAATKQYVDTKQRVVHMGTFQASGDNIPLSEEQINQIFSNDIPPILVFDDGSVSFFTLIPDIYSLDQRRCTFHSAGPYFSELGISSGFSVAVYDLYNGVLYPGDPGFVVMEDSAEFTVPVNLPADPTTALQAATKQYVDNAEVNLSKAKGTLSIANGGTGVTSMTGTDYSTNRPRGIVLQSSMPSSVPNGCIVGVYE